MIIATRVRFLVLGSKSVMIIATRVVFKVLNGNEGVPFNKRHNQNYLTMLVRSRGLRY